MIHLYTGLPGHSKTLCCVASVDTTFRKCPESAQRPVYYYGIKECELDWIEIEDINKVHEIEKGAVIVIDEVQNHFGSANKATNNPIVKKFADHRHRGHDFFLITQDPAMLDAFIRRLVERHTHIFRFFSLQYAFHYTYRNGVGDIHDKSKGHRTLKKFPKAYYGTYKSAEVHTHGKAVPYKLFATMGLLLCVVFGGFWWVVKVQLAPEPIVEKPTLDPQMTALIEATGQNTKLLTTAVEKLATFSAQFEAIDPDKPYSAPFYEPLMVAAAMPKVTGCAQFKYKQIDDCTCNNQQGNIVQVSRDYCLTFIKNGGEFDFTKPDDEGKSGNQQPELEIDNPISLDNYTTQASQTF